jgi:glycerol-3-phosphate dehydrogenase
MDAAEAIRNPSRKGVLEDDAVTGDHNKRGMAPQMRTVHWQAAGEEPFDVLILGGGITGASLYAELCRRGWRTLLLDRGDFASGTSQSSAMMVWGGLLYLRAGDVLTVLKLSRARDRMIAAPDGWTSPSLFHYIPSLNGGLSSPLIGAGLWFYWLLGAGRRRPPWYRRRFAETRLLSQHVHRGAFCYEEGLLAASDARFVLHWVTPYQPPARAAVNYCELESCDYARAEGVWHLVLRDRLRDVTTGARARLIVNCAGVWADTINRRQGIETPYRHALSKGVFVSFAREEGHDSPLIFDMGAHDDVMSWIPWGPVALWGPTETAIGEIEEGLAPQPGDIDFLLETANRHLRRKVGAQDVVSLRCGIRALAVDRDYVATRYPLELSRRSIVHAEQDLPWITAYGGKLTGSRELAGRIARLIRRRLEPSPGSAWNPAADPPAESCVFPGLDQPVVTPRWCRDQEFCCTLDDYLRRRTNIAQWVPREGLGRNGEYREAVRAAAREFHDGDAAVADAALAQHEQTVAVRFDKLLNGA